MSAPTTNERRPDKAHRLWERLCEVAGVAFDTTETDENIALSYFNRTGKSIATHDVARLRKQARP